MGIDLVADPWDAPIYPVMPGRVYAEGRDTDGALYVIIQTHPYFHAYWHLSQTFVSAGQDVDQNTCLGRQGATGNVTGVHLHLQIMEADHYGHGLNSTGEPIDPAPFLGDLGGADEMTQEQADKYAADLARSSIVSATWKAITGADIPQPELDKILGDMLLQHYWDQGHPEEAVNYVRAKVLQYAGDSNWSERTHTLSWFNHDPVREENGYNTRALSEYYLACTYPAAQATQIATNHVAAGNTFSKIITSDMQWWRDQLNQAKTQQGSTNPLEDAGNKEKLKTALSNLQDLLAAIEGTTGGGS